MNYTHLGPFSDLVVAARRQADLFSVSPPGPLTQEKIRDLLGFTREPEQPMDVQLEQRWEKDGLAGEEITWWAGYGPRTHAWFLRPAQRKGPLPCILALHDHGGFKYYGKEKIAEGPGSVFPVIQKHYDDYYGGHAWANALAKRGYAVLVHDAFLWGSRKFPIETMLEALRPGFLNHQEVYIQLQDSLGEIGWYNFLAGQHEHIVSKYCNLLGTSMAGIVCHEDRIALNYLLSRPDVQKEQAACIGLSGGGNRSALLFAAHPGLQAAAIIGLMSTYEALLDHYVATHTWMLFPFGLSRVTDWPDLAACRAPSPLLVQYDQEDDLFTPQGMQDAHQKIMEAYQTAGNAQAYTGQFYPGPHKFDLEMQEAAFSWLDACLR